MRHILLVILLCIIPFAPSHANQQVIDVIKAIEIEGTNIFTSLDEARSTLIKKGYEESKSGRGITRFKKGTCYIDFGKSLSTYVLKYKCDGSNPDAGAAIIRALDDLCAIENNGKDDRAGCLPTNPNTNATRIEEFKVMVDGDKYTAKIWDIQNHHGSRIRHIDIVSLRRKEVK